jgi:hypothetical protein
MNLKERIENNLTLWALSLAVTAFGAGVAADRWAKEVFGTGHQVSECKTERWQELARKSDWIPNAQCPAYPLKAQLSSPGTGTTLPFDESFTKTLRIPFVVSLSRPLGTDGDVGFVVKPKDSPNYFVVFPLISRTRETNSYRTEFGIELPVTVLKGNEYEVRGLLVDKKQKMGDRFTELSQILSADQSIILTEPVSVIIEK